MAQDYEPVFSRQEQRVAEQAQRKVGGAKRQNKQIPLLIRDDGTLWPNMPLIAAKKNMRPYHGDPSASLEDRQRYLLGLNSKRRVVWEEPEQEPFDLGKADVDEIVQFAMDQYGAALNPMLPIKQLRQQVLKLDRGELTADQLADGAGIGDDDDTPRLHGVGIDQVDDPEPAAPPAAPAPTYSEQNAAVRTNPRRRQRQQV